MILSDSQKKVLRRAVSRTLKDWKRQAAAARSRGESEPSFYDLPMTGVTPADMREFKRHVLIGDQGQWTRKGLEHARDLLRVKALKKKLGITGAIPSTVGEINALPVGTFLLKHGESLRNFVPADRPRGFLRIGEGGRDWIVSNLCEGKAYRSNTDPGGILEVVPLTPALLASMADVDPNEARIFIPNAPGNGKADTREWAEWVAGPVLVEGSEARQALKNTIERAIGSEVKIGEPYWEKGLSYVAFEYEKIGKKPQSMGFLKNRSNPVSYKIEVKKNGQRYGEFGPYKRKADADADAKALRQKGSGVRVSVVRSNPLTGYERTKAILKRAAKLIDEGSLAQADSLIRESGASRVDLSNILGSKRMKKMARFARSSRSNPRSLPQGALDRWSPSRSSLPTVWVFFEIDEKNGGYTGRYWVNEPAENVPIATKSMTAPQLSALERDSQWTMMKASRSNPGHQWIQEVQEEIEEDGTAGRFTAQARRAGYKDTMAFAEKIMHEWRAGRERVWNKREKRWQKVTTMTMRRANYLLNTRQRRNG